MASADQLKALLKSHIEGDDQRFFSVAMQVAAQEAKLGHGKLAEELRFLVDDAKRRQGSGQPTPISRPRGELANLLSVSYPKARLNDMVLDKSLEQQIQRIIREQRHATRILAHGLSPRRKLLLMGPPGTGKTLTASVLASELGIPLFQVRLDGLITKFMGETAAKLRQIFDATGQTRGIYFFDEFDAIGSQRGLTNDVGEIRRVLNSFLQMIEQDQSHSLIIAATNHADILDHALFRRFDDVLHYALPHDVQIAALLRARLHQYSAKGISWKRLSESAAGLSYAEITRVAEEVLKEVLIQDRQSVTEMDIRKALLERQNIAGKLKNKI
ncbi:MAG: ATP-binding protein [Smithella sp.]|jgi:SpoVK/Ycf46/Vps4 family AAA+-type ATPase